MILTIIAAVGSDGAIGSGGNLAFYVKADLRHFKELTMGCPVIMGRKTFESLPKGALPGRRNIVITRNAGFSVPAVETAASVDEAITLAGDVPQAFIIGGAEIYRQTIDRADRLEITFIDAECPGADTFFPSIDPERWVVTSESPAETDPSTGLVYRFVRLDRK